VCADIKSLLIKNALDEQNAMLGIKKIPLICLPSPIVSKKPLKRHPTRRSIRLHGKLRLIAYVLLFLQASFAVFFVSAGFAQDQNTSQVSESAQNQEKSQISLTPAERVWLAQNHTVRVRLTDYPPFVIANGGELKGLSIDYLKLIFERTGINFELRKEPASFEEALKSVKEHKDLDLLPTIVPTIERKSYIAFTQIYYSSPRVIFTRDDEGFVSNLEDLMNKTVANNRGSITHRWLKAKYPDLRMLLSNSGEQALRSVSTGKADALIINLALGSYLIQKRGFSNLKVAAPSPLKDQVFTFGIRKDWPELAGIIDKSLDAISAEERSAIVNRYLSPVKYEYGITPIEVLEWILLVGGTASVILLFFIIWNRALKKEVRARTSELTVTNKSLTGEIVERKKTHENLQKSEERFRTLQENVPVGVYRTSSDGELLSANPAVLKMLGFDAGEDMSSFQVSDFYKNPEIRSEILGHLKAEGEVTDFEAEFRRKDGSLFWGSLSAKRVTDADGNPMFIDGVVQDTSDRKQAELKLFDYQQRLKALASQLTIAEEQERRRIAADLHDYVSQSLALTRLQLAAISKSGDDAGLKKQLDHISLELLQMSSDIHQLVFELSSPTLRELGLGAAIAEWLEEKITKVSVIEVELIDQLHDGLDEFMSLILFRNVRELLTNTVKHAQASKLVVCLEEAGGAIKITIKDNGIGFNPEHALRKTNCDGGFGLFSVEERMADLDGSLTINSRSHQGATIIMTAPCKPQAGEANRC
jgi:PAS domain S-box-containing protein